MAHFHQDRTFGGGKKFGGRDSFSKKNSGGRDFGGRDGGRSTMHQAICDDCGNECTVPFRPSGNRPVYCNACFENANSSGSRRSGGRDFEKRNFARESGRSSMHAAVCDACGDDCMVPFKPAGDKPIYCNLCFGKGGNSENKNTEQFKEQFAILDAKLDRILAVLSTIVSQKKAQEDIKISEKEVTEESPKKKIKTPKAKKVAKKTSSKSKDIA